MVNRPRTQQPYIMPQTSSEIEFGARPAASAQNFCAARRASLAEHARRERVYGAPVDPINTPSTRM
jgi:hypothetical protein